MACKTTMKITDIYTVTILIAIGTVISGGQIIPEDATIWTAHENHIYFTNNTVRWTEGTIQAMSIWQITIGNIQNSFGLAYDHHTSRLVTSHPDTNILAIVFLDSNTSTVLYTGTSSDIGQMTIDWTARNLYWADGGYGWIAMKPMPESATFDSLGQHLRVVVETHLDKPTGITVHPDQYYLFWADAGRNPKIERSNLVGGERSVIVWHNLMSPACLTIDFGSSRLYWSDQLRGTVEYTDFDGKDRAVLASNPNYGYYGIAVFQDSLIFTAPNHNITGYYSLKSTIFGKSGRVLQYTKPLYYVDVFDKDEQPREQNEGCDSAHIDCDHICVHSEDDRGASCFCYDGYELHTGNGETCQAKTRVLERHLLFTSGSAICSTSVTAISSNFISLPVTCDVVSHSDNIRVFALDMTEGVVFFASGSTLFKSLTDGTVPEEMLKETADIIDMDYDWKTKELFWILDGGNSIHYVNTSMNPYTSVSKRMTSEVTNIAVDPHTRNVYWVDKSTSFTLRVWNRVTDLLNKKISSLYLKQPRDLEYNRLRDSLVWNDASGYIGVINVDGTNEKKYNTRTTGEDRHAVTVFKKFLISTTAEDDRHIDVIYEPDESEYHLTLTDLQAPILDMHVFDATLQPRDLDACEVDNGGCAHICVYGSNTHRCSCNLGYRLQADKVSCKTSLLDSNYYLVVDALNAHVYQIASHYNEDSIRSVPINGDNKPSALAFDMKRDILVWIDEGHHFVKKKYLYDVTGSESIIGTNVGENAQLAVDATSGNIYVTSGSSILVFDQYDNTNVVKNITDFTGTLGKIELLPEIGRMVWVESGPSPRLVMSNMDGTNVKVIHDDSADIQHPEDVAFDLDKGDRFYWCDSGLGKIEEVMVVSLTTRPVYVNEDLSPIALDVVGDDIYFIIQYRRKVYVVKTDGSGIGHVMESPLFGRLTHLYVSKPAPKEHRICGDCNGGCSTFCLPRDENKGTCICEDGQHLLTDLKTCPSAKRCNGPTAAGLSSFTDCCVQSPHAVCKPVCLSGYSLEYTSAVKCDNGRWNLTLETLCKEPDDTEENGPPLPLIAGAAGGGAVLLIIIIILVIVCKRRGKQKDVQRRPSVLPSVREVNGVAGGREHPYDTGDGISPPLPPDRPLTRDEQADGGEYHYLDDAMIAKRVELPPEDVKKRDMSRERSASGRYSRFPQKNDPYYIHPTNEFTPRADYPTYGLDNPGADMLDDGYLAASSVGEPAHVGSDFSETGAAGGTYLRFPSPRGSYFSDDVGHRGSRTDKPSRDTLSEYRTPIPRDVNGIPVDVPMAHFGTRQGSSSGFMHGFENQRF